MTNFITVRNNVIIEEFQYGRVDLTIRYSYKGIQKEVILSGKMLDNLLLDSGIADQILGYKILAEGHKRYIWEFFKEDCTVEDMRHMMASMELKNEVRVEMQKEFWNKNNHYNKLMSKMIN